MTQEIRTKLEPFFVEFVDYSIDLHGISFEEMLKKEEMNSLISSRTDCFNCVDRRVGGANAMKWFGNLITAHLYLLSIENKWMSYQSLSLEEKGKGASVLLLQPTLEDVPRIGREEFARKKLTQLFQAVQPLFNRISETSGLSKQQTWGLLANPYYKHVENWVTSDGRTRVEKDVQLLKSLDAHYFGLKRNPFDITFRYVDSWWEPVEPVRVKAACCMSYLKSEGQYCFSCPKLSKSDRLARGEQLRIQG